jgi:hypothetical protein
VSNQGAGIYGYAEDDLGGGRPRVPKPSRLLAGADVLAAHDFEVVYRPERIDQYSGAAFAGTYMLIGADQLDALWDQIDRLIDPFDGECPELGAANESP